MSGSERSRSRSHSPTLTNHSTNSKASRRHQSRSPSERSYSDESFYSEASRKNAKTEKKKPTAKGPNKKGGKSNSKDSSRRGSVLGGAAPRSNHGAVSRIMSANRLRITEMRNRVAELTDQLVVLQQENRDLKRLIWKQERKLNGYEHQEGGMPQIMQRQADETQMLREQIRRQKERCDKKSKKLKEKEDELVAMQRLVKKMQGLVEDKKLMDRKKLSEKLKQTEDKLQKEQEKNKTLEKHVQHLSKNHKHQLASERAKEQDLERQMEKLQEKYDKLEMDMKEKEKERNLNNIYSNRSMKPPHRLDSSVQSSQSDLTKTSKSRPDGKERTRMDEKQRRAGGSGDPTGRTEDYSPKKFERKHEDPLIQFSHGEEYGYQESQASVYKVADKRDKEKDIPKDKEKNNPRDKEKDTPRDKEKDTARDRERESEIKTEDPLSWLREERIREQEQERRSWLEAKEKEDAKSRKEERRREEEEERKRQEERQREEEEEEKRKEQEQQRRTEHRQKQNQEQNHFDNRNNNKNDNETPRKVKKDEEKDDDRFVKDDLLAKLRAIDEGKHDNISASARKEYTFTEPVNNLHQGLPSHGQRKSNNLEDDSPAFGSYRPSFAHDNSKTTKKRDSRTSDKPQLGNKNKNSDPFAELFGAEPKRASNISTDARQDSPVLLELGSSTMKAKPHPTQLHREKQAIVPIFRSTANHIEVSDEEIEELAI